MCTSNRMYLNVRNIQICGGESEMDSFRIMVIEGFQYECMVIYYILI